MSLFSHSSAPVADPRSNGQLRDAEYREVSKLVYQHSRINLGENKRELVTARLSKRLRALGLPSYRNYLDLLGSAGGTTELANFVDAISTNHTYFFREETHFDFLQQTILPQMGVGLRRPFRMWCAAASSGEEPYSLAITMEEFFAQQGGSWTLDGSDISTKVLKIARDGVYPKERLQKVPLQLMRRYFQKGTSSNDGFFRVKTNLSRHMRFHQLNLLGGAYPFNEPFDTIFCRNVMIYFDKATQQELVERMTPLLQPGGYLLIGHAESLTGIKHSLKMVKPAIYQKPGK
ncbi:MAG: CheR family methyltransferase [Verrucomicrobiota bacterium]